jgi:signal transduction histidine kinase
MPTELRKTGIDILGDVPWGTHFCQFYDTAEDLVEILVPYFKAGLENSEFCMWVCSKPLGVKEAEKALRAAVPDLDRYLKTGQIEILRHDEWYLQGGTFETQRVLGGWVDKHNGALAAGFEGLRLTGNTRWLEGADWADFTAYEEQVNSVIGKYRMLAVCSYALDKCGAAEVVDVVSNHRFALIRRRGKWQIIRSSEYERADMEIRSLAKFPSENPYPVLRIRSDGTVLYGNTAAEPVLKEKGSSIGEAAPEEWRERVTRALKTGSTEAFELEHGDRVYSFRLAPVREAGYVNWYGRDITEQRRAEAKARGSQHRLLQQQRQRRQHVEAELGRARDALVRTTRLAAIGQMSASIAHDLRNPLGTMRNAVYYLKRRLPEGRPEIGEYLDIIDQEINAADRIISNLLGAARAKEPVKQALDLGRTVQEVFDRLGQTEAIRLRMSLKPDPFTVRADPDQLRQVIHNLVQNAEEAMGHRGEILVEAGRDVDGDAIVFRDTGPGVAPEVRDSLFEPLVTTKAKGIGLGLTICRHIVERHGGTIELIDRGKSGAAFRIRLPRE